MGITVDGIIASGEFPLTIGPVPACSPSETVCLVIRYFAFNADPSDLCFQDDALELPPEHSCFGCTPWSGNFYAGHDQGFGNSCTLGTNFPTHLRGAAGQPVASTWMSWAGGAVLAPIPAGTTLDIIGGAPSSSPDTSQPPQVMGVVYQVRGLALSNLASFVCPPPLLPTTGADGTGAREAVAYSTTSAGVTGLSGPDASGTLSTDVGCNADEYLNAPNGEVLALTLAMCAPMYQSFKTRTLFGCTCHKSITVGTGFDLYDPDPTAALSMGTDDTLTAPVTTSDYVLDDTNDAKSSQSFDLFAAFGHEIFGGGAYAASYDWGDPPRANNVASFVPCNCQLGVVHRHTDAGANAVFYCGSDDGLPDCVTTGVLRAQAHTGRGPGPATGGIPPSGLLRASGLVGDGVARLG